TGQVLLRIDAPEMLDERRQKEAELKRSEAEVGQAQAGIEAAESDVASSRAGVVQAEAALSRARSVLEQYRAEAARIEELAKSRSVTPQVADESRARLQAAEAGDQEALAGIEAARAKVQESESAVAQAQADLVAAEARQEVARANLAYVETMIGYLELKAPFDGVVTERNTDTGHLVRASNEGSLPLLAVARTDKLRVFVAIPESEAAFVTSGEQADPAIVSVQALSGRQFPASVTRTAWALDPANRSLRVEIDLDNADGQLRPGMYATASMTLDRRQQALTVPTSALVRDGAQVLVCAIRDGKIARTAVQTGLRVGDDIEVLNGLSDDASIVLVRADSLKDGQAVEPIAAAK
ncbi:MAG: efflux RND transporter periplasmic adaptor subunit, partial [Planctomycetaceae bacterium]|nr:efflux RND transporter periplasmic adaptor subunit [Planctomycetaceae bacterium]